MIIIRVLYHLHHHLYLSRSLVDRWGVTYDQATGSLHFSHLPLTSQPSSWRRPMSCQSIPGCCLPIYFLSASPSPSLYCAMQDRLGRPYISCHVPVSFQFTSLYCGQKVFVGPNGLPNYVSHHFVG